MTKQATKIRTLEELQARKSQLEKEIAVSQKSAKESVGPVKNKAGAFVLSKTAPVLAVGVGLFIAFKLFGGKKEEKAQVAPVPRQSIADPVYLGDEKYQTQQRSAPTSSSFVSVIRGLLPFIKIVLPFAQAAFANYQASRATTVAEKAASETSE